MRMQLWYYWHLFFLFCIGNVKDLGHNVNASVKAKSEEEDFVRQIV